MYSGTPPTIGVGSRARRPCHKEPLFSCFFCCLSCLLLYALQHLFFFLLFACLRLHDLTRLPARSLQYIEVESFLEERQCTQSADTPIESFGAKYCGRISIMAIVYGIADYTGPNFQRSAHHIYSEYPGSGIEQAPIRMKSILDVSPGATVIAAPFSLCILVAHR